MRTVRCTVSAWRVALAASAAALARGAASAQTARVVTLADVESAVQRQPQVLVASAGVDAAVGVAQRARAPLLPQIVSIAGGTTLAPNYDYYQFQGDITNWSAITESECPWPIRRRSVTCLRAPCPPEGLCTTYSLLGTAWVATGFSHGRGRTFP